ncbi:MAG: hypothetical protein IKF78_03800 [Atopobiaceae bacterium]|nr:hypothetical protein [Atopobiaceae bacterium]
MKTLTVFAEEPEEELWRMLLQYSYEANIRRYYTENHVTPSDDVEELANCISGALLQADEYYKASKTVSLQVEPLLLYYGTTNLFYAMCALMTGKIPSIENHGMCIELVEDSDKQFIADTRLTFQNPSSGGIHVFAKQLGCGINFCDYRTWDLFDFLDSIAEVKYDFERCYTDRTSCVLPLQSFITSEGVIEKAFVDEDKEESTLNAIEGFSSAYLMPQRIPDHNGESYIVLRRKPAGKDIRPASLSGQSYLLAGHKKNGKPVTIPSELSMYIALFALSSLCRYYPAKWNPFVTKDSTGERLIVEKLLYYSRRTLPNIVLNRIQDQSVLFVSERYEPENRVQLVGEHEAKELVDKEVRFELKRQLIRNASQSVRNGFNGR